MNCYLVYRKEDAEKNTAYIELFRQGCLSRGLGFSLVFHEDLIPNGSPSDTAVIPPAGSNDKPYPEHQKAICDFRDGFVINRTRDALLSKACEYALIPVWNASRVVTLGNDKSAAYAYVRSLGLPVLPYADTPELPFPYVMKSADGHGGTEVFLIHSEKEKEEVLKRYPHKRFLYQEPCDTPGRDLRVYLVGQEIVGAMLRSSDTDFRANYSLGGRAEVYTLSAAEKALVETIIRPLSIGHCGIDFLFHKGGLIFNEIEDVVGSRMLYRHTEVDVVSLYLDEILKKL